jgi:UDP:flavonoid glycosyltransferase YjiC (YdhE family)
VHHTIGPGVDFTTLELCTDALSPLWRSFGYAVPPFAGLYRGLTIDMCPPSLGPGHPPAAIELWPLRPVTVAGKTAADPPDWLRPLTTRPLVYVTLGTFSNSDLAVFRAVIDALAPEPVSALVTVGHDGDPAALEPLPANVRVERYVPQATVLPHCVAVIHHAGAGTMLGALAHGLPQVALPQGADNFVNARVLTDAGAGVQLLPGSTDAGAIRAALRQVRDDVGFARAAKRIADEIAAMPSPTDVAELLHRRHADSGMLLGRHTDEWTTRGNGSR